MDGECGARSLGMNWSGKAKFNGEKEGQMTGERLTVGENSEEDR